MIMISEKRKQCSRFIYQVYLIVFSDIIIIIIVILMSLVTRNLVDIFPTVSKNIRFERKSPAFEVFFRCF